MRTSKLALFALFVASLLSVTSARALSTAQPDTRLVEAVKSGDRVAVETLLREHVPVDSAEGDGSTALHWAAYEDNLAIAQLLLNAHAHIDVTTRDEALTPLFMACQNGSVAMVELLLKHGANANETNTLGTTPLMLAAASGSVPVVTLLLEHSAQVNAREQGHDQTALMFAANYNRADVIRLLASHGADLGASSKVVAPYALVRHSSISSSYGAKDTATAGKTAAFGTKAEGEGADEKPADAKSTDAKLVEVSKDVSAKTDDTKPTDSDDVKQKRHREYGAKIMGGMTPLLYAARQGNVAAMEALLDSGAKIDEVSGSEHSTPLVMTIGNGHFDAAKILIERGANVNLANDMGVTPLYAAIDVQWAPYEWSPEPIVAQEKTNYLGLMQLLVAHGANVNARLGKPIWSRVLSENRNWIDNSGATAFYRAAEADDVAAMKLLIAAGADPKITSAKGTTPLMVAAGLGWSANYSRTYPTRPDAVKYCLSLGANMNQADELGYTALHGAAFFGDLDLIKYMVDQGAKTDVRTKAGDTVADLANGPFEKSLPNPKAVALLEQLGSPNSHNCRSSDCVPPVKEDKKPEVAANDKKPEVADVDKKPAPKK